MYLKLWFKCIANIWSSDTEYQTPTQSSIGNEKNTTCYMSRVGFYFNIIPATLVVGFTTGGPIFEVFQVLAEDFKIVRFSLVLFVRLLCQWGDRDKGVQRHCIETGTVHR